MLKAKQLKSNLNAAGWRQARKIGVLIVGGAVMLVGIAMLVLPGPAFVVIPAGLAILATEFEWARRYASAIVHFFQQATKKENLKRFVRANSLSLTLFLLFFVFLGGQLLAGFRTYNVEQMWRGEAPQKFGEYVRSGHCIEAIFENWESEFLQMAALVWLTVWLRQKGAVDSKDTDEPERRNETKPRPDSPWPVRRGGWVARLYEHSLSLALLALFAASFLLHAVGGRAEFNEELARHGRTPVSFFAFLGSSQFWFESFQNWQSEFLSVGVLLVFSIFLREKSSPESKPVNAPHHAAG
jgi:uncharacterized protein (TIGR02611 family)